MEYKSPTAKGITRISKASNRQFTNFLLEDLRIELLKKEDEETIVTMIQKKLNDIEEAGSILAATIRRLENFFKIYSQEGSVYFVIKTIPTQSIVGGAGLGPFAGLPVTEGLAEIREMVIDDSYENDEVRKYLIENCIEEARNLGYSCIYFETTTHMSDIKKLIQKLGFNPVTEKNKSYSKNDLAQIPCYFKLINQK
ncbi:MAG: GNAT family N-acetyltransferase [Oligoflexales bacterium]|nr:GNAT family N-acetyltransferase [Oligoflexales bacterium]